ncbi:MFS transporter [Yinghuangia seranimata]|uniref:MFS transporter n=1 Tax=Yinghuangia seranimata TaxID=408067 RepID=UPI00248CA02E|nr:MFS transporter [Yinghuangia seranimata]MDI2129764.1 MFS transporter [Yinghuangia seranimata]
MTQSNVAAREAAPAIPAQVGPLDADGKPRFKLGPLYVTLPLANLALYLVWMGVGSFLIPLQVTSIKGHPDPDALKNAVAIGAALAAIGNPVFGQISDRTRSRFGRRAPWMLLCAGGGALALIGQANATSIGALAVTWGLVQLILNGYQAALTAAMPDRIPASKYGIFSGLVGLGIPLGIVVSAYTIAGIDVSKLGLDGSIGGFDGKFAGEKGYYLIAGILVAAMLIFIFVTPDKSSKGMVVEKFSFKKFLSNFWLNPKKHPDFGWAFLSRFGVVAGYFTVLTYNMYILMEYVKVAPQDVLPTMGFLMVLNAIATVVASVVVGKLVDHFGVIKPFVLGSGVLAGLSLFIPMIWGTVNGMTAFNVVNGFAFGMYMAVDMALITKVLPRGEDAGKDMGLINIANAAPQVAAPFIASAIVENWGYHALFPISACIALVGSVLVVFVKSVR